LAWPYVEDVGHLVAFPAIPGGAYANLIGLLADQRHAPTAIRTPFLDYGQGSPRGVKSVRIVEFKTLYQT